jgi:hypothetical protein
MKNRFIVIISPSRSCTQHKRRIISTPGNISGNQDRRRSWDQPDPRAPVVVVPPEWSRAEVEALRATGRYHFGHSVNPETGRDRGLEAIFGGAAPLRKESGGAAPTDWQPLLIKWLREIQAECACESGKVAAMWHPLVTAEKVRPLIIGKIL